MSRLSEMVEPKWEALLLVCKDCKKRSKGPRDLKSKAATSALKHASKDSKPRPRVLSVACLGVCPSGALAVARVGGGSPARVACIASLEEVAGATLKLMGAKAPIRA